MRNAMFHFLAVLTPLCLTLSGCKREQVIKIATQSPLTQEKASGGIDMMRGVKLAVEQLSGPLKEMKINVEVAPFDDQDPAGGGGPVAGVANAKVIAADPAVLAVVGHLGSGVQIPSSEIYHEAGLANISPANTNPKVTDRGYKEVSRICGRDDVQGAVGAQYLKKIHVTTAYVLDTNTLYSRGIAEFFKKEAESQGIKVVGSGSTEEQRDFSKVLAEILPKKPEAVYLAGGYEYAGLIKQARAKGYKGVFMSVDAFDGSDAAILAGDALMEGGGTYFSTVAGPAFAYPDAAKFVADFKATYGAPPQPYAAQAYDCAALALQAIEKAAREADGGAPTRAAVAQAVRALDFHGITGNVTFNAKGDPIKARYFVIQVTTADPQKWVANRVAQTLDIAPPQ